MQSRKILYPSILLVVALIALTVLGQQRDQITVGGQEFDRIEVRVNSFTASAQSHISLDMNGTGSVVAAWDSRRQDSGTYGVFARWIAPDGCLMGPEEQINLERRSMQERPSVAVAADGSAWFAWQSFNQDGQAGAIIGRLEGDEGILNETTVGDQSQVVVDRLLDGRTVAAWKTSGESPLETRIAIRLFAASGEPVSEEIILDGPGGSRDHLPAIAADGNGGFVAAWARVRSDGHADGVYACRFEASGSACGPVNRVSDAGAGAIEPAVAADGQGNYTVAWLQLDEESDYDVWMRAFRADGAPLAPARVASSDRSGWQSGAAIASASSGQTLVAWNTYNDDSIDSNIYARLFDPQGVPLCEDFRVNTRVDGDQALPAASGARRVALGDDGRMAFAWEGDSGQGDRSAANVTILTPVASGFGQDLVAGIRGGQALLASLLPDRTVHLDAAAEPYVPPTFDAADRGVLLDPNNLVIGERENIGFTAITNTGWRPPDPHMAAGPDQVMAIVNGGIASFSKDGTELWFDDISGAAGFWGDIGADPFVFDPEVIFDPYEDRWIAMANERGDDNHSYFLIAISHTSDASNPTDWYKYRLDVTALAGNDIDSPNIAVDRDAIYLTADFFTGGQKYLIYIVDKASVINGGSPVTTSYLRTGSQSFGIPVMYTDDAPMMYMIEHFESNPSSSVRLWAIIDPLGTPTVTSYTLTVPTYYSPARLQSAGTSVRPYTFDERFWSCMYRNGSLWAAHHMSLSASPRITVSRWYEIAMNGWPSSADNPTLVQSGTVAPPGDVYCSFNSIFADQNNNAMMVFARSSVDEFFSIARTVRLSSDPVGFMSPPEFVKQSTVAYTQDRWGDYSAIVTDPVNPNLFWMHHEYAAASTQWHTWIASEAVLDPAAVPPASDLISARIGLAPNPTSGPATLSFDLLESAPVAVEIFDVSGRLVDRIDLGTLAARGHQFDWDGRDATDTDVANGIYMMRLLSDGRLIGTERLVITR